MVDLLLSAVEESPEPSPLACWHKGSHSDPPTFASERFQNTGGLSAFKQHLSDKSKIKKTKNPVLSPEL